MIVGDAGAGCTPSAASFACAPELHSRKAAISPQEADKHRTPDSPDSDALKFGKEIRVALFEFQ